MQLSPNLGTEQKEEESRILGVMMLMQNNCENGNQIHLHYILPQCCVNLFVNAGVTGKAVA